ncbi:N-6 DNA methylase [Oscillatoriales cyanobacterium LEGE 11467]|uniref:N-6 DNA methylase n=1 Tax=Zarconia navalis LEGE 11467 TaxID=1828826 RepID=A0A928Z6B2_9CYAN|nr:N-6 DNA methylase [Zarconia navalis]MBE9040192.1 N-6 DNA methylase [Zarconia navalis LEGE 11467]
MNNTTKNKNRENRSQSTQNTFTKLKQDFCNKFDKLAYSRSHFEVFRDWVEISAIAMHNRPYNFSNLPKDECFETLEADYLKLVAKYDRETLNEFAALLEITMIALNSEWGDFLGEIYTEMEIGGKRSKQTKGEFFTPYPVAQLAAEMTLLGCEEVIERQGYLTISKPACGAGAMLIAACEVIARKGYAPNKVMFFEAIDINPFCCHMAFVQFSCLELPGIVCHGDTLKYEFQKRWETATFKIWSFLTGKNPFRNMEQTDNEPTTPTTDDRTV